MSTLHEQMEAAIKERLAVAQAAARPFGGRWSTRMTSACIDIRDLAEACGIEPQRQEGTP
jgi:hypothetical protein